MVHGHDYNYEQPDSQHDATACTVPMVQGMKHDDMGSEEFEEDEENEVCVLGQGQQGCCNSQCRCTVVPTRIQMSCDTLPVVVLAECCPGHRAAEACAGRELRAEA